ncbi:MAG: zf-HC2 domain-containing protein [Candidatus Aminicenantales bacterium]
MTCRRVRKLIPLAAGGDLRPRPAAAFRAHVDSCPGCREELERFRRALAGIMAAAKTAAVAEWSEGEWDALMARVATESRGTRELPGGVGAPVVRPRWAAASVVGAFLCLIVLSILFRGPSSRPETMKAAGDKPVAAEAGEQDQLTMILVSPESGLQVVWIFDKNFDWKGDQE